MLPDRHGSRQRDVEGHAVVCGDANYLSDHGQQSLLVIGDAPRQHVCVSRRAALAAGRLRVALGLLGRGDRFGTLLSGIESKTVETNRALEDLAMRIRSDPTLADAFASREAGELMSVLGEKPSGQAFLDELQAFLDRYGHRETASPLLVSQPTWKDAPEVVLGILKGFVLTEPRPQTGRPA